MALGQDVDPTQLGGLTGWIAGVIDAMGVPGVGLLYWLGAALGEDRLKRWLDRIPVVDTDDLDRADRWFERYGSWAVLFGRMIPVVRSLVSVPAGANHMPVGRFLALTTLGSGVWNAIFVGLGYGLGSRWQEIDRYAGYVDYGLLAVLVLMVGFWVVKKRRRSDRRRAASTR